MCPIMQPTNNETLNVRRSFFAQQAARHYYLELYKDYGIHALHQRTES